MNRIRIAFSLALAAAACQATKESAAPAKDPAAPGKPATAAAQPSGAKSARGPTAAASEVRTTPLPIGAAIVRSNTEMKNVDDQMVSIASVKGEKGTLVIFTCNHCPYVKAWEPRIAKAGNMAQEMGFGVIAINSNDPRAYAEDGFDEMKARAAKLGFEFPYVVDATSNMARAFGASKTPEVFLFDAGDELVYYGAIDDNYQDADQVEARYLEDAVKAVAAGEPVPKAVTKALGCSIKLRDPA